MTNILIPRLGLWDQFRMMLVVNSPVLSDKPGLKHFNFEFVIRFGRFVVLDDSSETTTSGCSLHHADTKRDTHA